MKKLIVLAMMLVASACGRVNSTERVSGATEKYTVVYNDAYKAYGVKDSDGYVWSGVYNFKTKEAAIRHYQRCQLLSEPVVWKEVE